MKWDEDLPESWDDATGSPPCSERPETTCSEYDGVTVLRPVIGKAGALCAAKAFVSAPADEWVEIGGPDGENC